MILSSQMCPEPAVPGPPGGQRVDYLREPREMTVFMAAQCLLELKGLK